MKISIVSPVYMAEEIVPHLISKITEEVEKITLDYEIILVDDGSPDNSWNIIEQFALQNKKIKAIKLSRNFGQHFALTAGLEHAKGDYIIVMDCDLQDDPVYIKDLIEQAEKGYQIVYTRKKGREHSFLKNIVARFYYKIFNYLVENKLFNATDKVGSYSLITKNVLNAFLNFKDYRRHYLMVLRWLGFNYTIVDVDHKKRYSGKSSYSFKKLLSHALDGITSQSDKLLRLTAGIGLFLSGTSFLFAIFIMIRYLFKPFQAVWASIMVLILFMSGLIILSIGICGIYIGKTFEQSKNRPLFIIDKKLNV